MRRGLLLFGVVSLFCSFPLRADYIATSVSLSAGHGEDTFNASGPLFSLSGLTTDYLRRTAGVGDVFSAGPAVGYGSTCGTTNCLTGTVDFAGPGSPWPADLDGQVTAYTLSTFTFTGSGSYTVPAVAMGSFTASPMGPSSAPGYPPSGTYPVTLDIDLPGTITFTFGVNPSLSPPNCTPTAGPTGCVYGFSMSFGSSPVPEPSALSAVLLGCLCFLLIPKAASALSRRQR